jgi:hypothetical protein
MQLAEQHVGCYKLPDFMNAGLDEEANGASAVIGPKGGVVTVTDPTSPIYGTSLRIPAGALDAPVRITIREGLRSCDFGLGPSINLSPGGLHFKCAAILTVYLDDTGTETDDFEGSIPAFYHYDESSARWAHNSNARLEKLGDAVLCELHHL